MSGIGIRVRIARGEPGLASALAAVLIDCVEGGASVGFMAPLSVSRAVGFWEAVIADADCGGRILLIAEHTGGEIVGTVQVVPAVAENQPHRGDIAKLLVHRSVRHRGVGRALMLDAESAARAAGRTLLVLDTVTGGDAERLYHSLGWCRVGAIPGFALWPDGPPCSTTVFYKQLA